MAARTQQPPVSYTTKGAIAHRFALVRPSKSVWVFTGDGVPTAGTSGDGVAWAGIGSLYIDHTNGKLYINTGTKASPTWTVVGSQS